MSYLTAPFATSGNIPSAGSTLSRLGSTIPSPSPSSSVQSSPVFSPFVTPPLLDPLERDQREIERRRHRLNERKERILHAKTRVIGVDTDALAAQVAERAERERLEFERDMYYDDLSKYYSKTLNSLEEEKKLNNVLKLEELREYRRQQAAEKQQRELRDRSQWPNLIDTNTNFLNFQGEDRTKAQREKMQKQQQQEWLSMQIEEQMRKEERERKEQADYAAAQASITAQQLSNESLKKTGEVNKLKNLQEYNQQQSAQKRAMQIRHAQQTLNENTAELSSTLHSALLNEYVPVSSLGPNRAIPYHYKGMSAQQRQAILDQQQAQIDEKRRREAEEREKELADAQASEQIRKELLRQQRAKDMLEKERLLALRDERQYQNKQKIIRDQYLNNVVYTNPVQEEFFDQFGTSAR